MATANDIFNAIKAHELDFPIPANSATIEMGQFNATTGEFSGVVTEWDVLEPDEAVRKPRRIKIPAAEDIDAVNAVLRFTSTKPGVTVVANGHSVHSGGTTVEINVGPVSTVAWTIRAQGHSYHDTLQIGRPPQIGIGAFVVPILPVGLVYEPPPDASKKNQAVYTTTHSVSTQLKLSFTNGTSTTNDGAFLNFANASALLKSVADSLKAFQAARNPGASGGAIPWVAAAAAAASLLSSLIGSTSETSSTENQVIQNQSLTARTTTSDTLTTGAASGVNAGGPGVGDQFYVLRNARLMWITEGGKLHLTLLDFEREATIGVAPLKAGGGAIGLDGATAAAVLALDPFVAAGPNAVLPGNRFTLVKTCEIDQAPGRHDFSLTTSTESSVSTVQISTQVNTKQEREGWLGFLGIGPSANRTTRTTISNSQASDTTTTDTQVGTVSLFSTATEPPYAVEIYQDRVFGSFAFRAAPQLATLARVSGVLLDAAGRPRPHTEVTLKGGGKTFATRSDARGNFAFRSSGIPVGNLEIGSGRHTVRRWLTRAAPVAGIELRLDTH